MSTFSYLNLKDSRFWCWWGAWDTHFKDNMSFWSIFLHYSPGILIPSDYSFCCGPVHWVAVQCAVTKCKDGLKFASTGSLVSFQKLLFLVPHCNALKVSLHRTQYFKAFWIPKAAFLKPQARIRSGLPLNRCMKHCGCIFPITRAPMPIFNRGISQFLLKYTTPQL